MKEPVLKFPSDFSDQVPSHLVGESKDHWCHWMAASHNMIVYRQAYREACSENSELREALSVARIRMDGHDAEKELLKSQVHQAQKALQEVGIQAEEALSRASAFK